MMTESAATDAISTFVEWLDGVDEWAGLPGYDGVSICTSPELDARLKPTRDKLVRIIIVFLSFLANCIAEKNVSGGKVLKIEGSKILPIYSESASAIYPLKVDQETTPKISGQSVKVGQRVTVTSTQVHIQPMMIILWL